MPTDSTSFVRIRRSLAAILVVCLFGSAAIACSVPVFRYALEHWQADPYVAIVFHRGGLSDEQQTLVDQLQPTTDDGRPTVNLIVRTVDLDDEPSDVVRELWEQHDTDTLPLLSLQTPPKLGQPQTAWQGEFNASNVEGLLTSPVRDQLRKRLLEGDSVVWVYLESGMQTEDDANFTLLNNELDRLEQEIELPPIEEVDLDDLSVDPTALKIAFSALRLSRDDPAEQPLIEMLMRVESDLREEPYVNQAMAFPVFGRGRALYALVGDGITPETIEDASRFLAGACQCTVKAQNPGVDLVMAVNWQQLVSPALPYDDAAPTLTGLTSFAGSMGARANNGPAESAAISDAVAAASTEPAAMDPSPIETQLAVDAQPKVDAGTAAVTVTTIDQTSASVDALTQNITLILGLIVAAVVVVTVIVLRKSS